MSANSQEIFKGIPTSTVANEVRINETWQNSLEMQNRGQERLGIQKAKNYTNFLNNFWQLLASVDALKVEEREGHVSIGYHGWTTFWDMKSDINKLETELKNSFAQTKNPENDEKIPKIQQQLIDLKYDLKYYFNDIFGHDILDHLLNGQNQMTTLSDSSQMAEANLQGEIFKGYQIIDYENKDKLYLMICRNYRSLLERELTGIIKNTDSTSSKFHIQVINLLNRTDQETLWQLLNKYNDKPFEIGKNPQFQEIMQKMSELFTRGQVMRGILALAYEKYNTVYLKMMKNGINLEENAYLEKIKQETMVEIGKINERMSQNPENFNSYTDYFKAYLPELQFDQDNDYLPVLEMRERMYDLIEGVMNDDLMEKLAREMLIERQK